MMQCSACNANILVTQKRIKCTNGNCNHNYHAECVKYSDSSLSRAKWTCPICSFPRPTEGENSNTGLPVRGTKEHMPKSTSPSTSLSTLKLDTSTILDEIRNLRQDMHSKFETQQDTLEKFCSTLSTVQQEIREMGSQLYNIICEMNLTKFPNQ